MLNPVLTCGDHIAEGLPGGQSSEASIEYSATKLCGGSGKSGSLTRGS